MNGISKGMSGTVLLLLGIGVYFGISTFMLNEYQLSVKTSHFIGLLSTGIYYFLCLLAWILSKAIPKLYETHGLSEDEDPTDKDNH